MKPGTLLMLVVALGCGLAAMLLTNQYLSKDNQNTGDKVALVVAAVDVQPGVLINKEMVKVVEYPAALAPAGAMADLNKVVNRSARYFLSSGEFVTETKLAKEGELGIQTVIPEGERAVTVKTTTDRAIAGFVKPGSFVDVVGLFKKNNEEAARIILQNVKVLAINTDMTAGKEGETKGKVVEMVTLLVKPEEAEGLVLANTNAALQLILRSNADKAAIKTSGVTGDQLASGKLMKKDGDREEEPEALKVDESKILGENKSAISGFADLLQKLNETAPQEPVTEEPKAETVVAKVDQPMPAVEIAPVPAIPPAPPKKLKRVIYRDLEGNVLMEVLLDAESKLAGSLRGIAEDVQLTSTGELQLDNGLNNYGGTGNTKKTGSQRRSVQ